ncbi:UDP-glucuronosyltransferase 2B17-like [Scaptodrosophila lebanonensis]|uniref:UDP-glucuronosyltransferase n=1 Tax=Drosophila lebanonensis TaxID=7225 RepID=A0A6J2U7L4_DROLE|nr:UDP-glucuronosyltransferase 2B17-like [Scaptodrosophila lebanonensis]
MARNGSSKLIFLLRLLIWALVGGSANSLNILGLFPYRSMSHFQMTLPITRGLAAAGHYVDVLSPFPDQHPPPRYTDYALSGKTLYNNIDLHTYEKRTYFRDLYEFFMIFSLGVSTCNQTLNSQALDNILRHAPGYYDVILVDTESDCMTGVAYILRAPVIALTSTALMPWHYGRMGAPIIPSHMPAYFLGESQEMSFLGRLDNFITTHTFNWLHRIFYTPAADEMLRQKFGPRMPSTNLLVKYTSLFFVNQHYSLSGPKPFPPNIIELAGIHLQRPRALPSDLKLLLESATDGVVIISWGSLIRASSVPPTKLNAILNAISRFKQQFIWKWENDTMPNKPKNLHIVKWLPQQDILCHPNVRAFISHGGMMGVTEAVHCGVPILGTPIYGDQFLNIASLVERGMAVNVNYNDISEKAIYEALKEILQKKYQTAAKVVAFSFNERSQTPLETALWWVEHVANTKGARLTQPSAVRMSSFVYNSLDVYLVLAIGVLLTILIDVALLRFMFSMKSSAAEKSQIPSDNLKSNVVEVKCN